MARVWILMVLLTGCLQPNAIACMSGSETWTCPAGAVCDPARQGCITDDQLHSCIDQPDGTPCAIGGPGTGVCETQICEQSRCGDGFVVAPEQCDGERLGSEPSCKSDGFYEDQPKGCNDDCTYETQTACMSAGYCGDSMINGPELCEGVTPPSLTCVDLGYGAGFLGCRKCGPNLDDCKLLQWTSHVVAQQLTAVHGAADGQVFAVGRQALVTRYDGSVWSELDTSPCTPANHRFTFNGVYALGNGKALLAGGEGVVMPDPMFDDAVIVAVDGATCTRIPVGTGARSLEDVWEISPTNIWAVGAGIFHFDGTTWTRSNMDIIFVKLFALGPSDIYAAGTGGLWHFDGATWAQLTIASSFVYAIAARSATDVYVGGDAGVEHWNGTSWSGPDASLGTILSLATDGSHLFAGAYSGPWLQDGAAWTTLAMPQAYARPVDGMWASSKGDVYVTSSARIAKYPGNALSTQAIAAVGESIAVVDRSTAYALTSSGLEIYNGSTWIEETPSGSPYAFATYADMWRAPSGNLYFGQIDNGGPALVRRRANGTWDPSPLATIPGGMAAMWGVDDNDLWMITTGSTTFAHWSGGGAVSVDTPCTTCTPGGMYEQMWGSSSTNIFAVGLGGAIAHWTGAMWSVMASGTTADLYSLWGGGANDVYAVGDHVFLHYDGSAWSPLEAPPGRGVTRTLWGTAGNDLFVSTPQGVYHWDGAHWAPVRVTLDSQIQVIGGSGAVTFLFDDASTAIRLLRSVDWSNLP